MLIGYSLHRSSGTRGTAGNSALAPSGWLPATHSNASVPRLNGTAFHGTLSDSVIQPASSRRDLTGVSRVRHAPVPPLLFRGNAGCLIAGTPVLAGAAPASGKSGNAHAKRSGRRNARRGSIEPPARRRPGARKTRRPHRDRQANVGCRKTSGGRSASTDSPARRGTNPTAQGATNHRRRLARPRTTRLPRPEAPETPPAPPRSGENGDPASNRRLPWAARQPPCRIFLDRPLRRAEDVAATVAS